MMDEKLSLREIIGQAIGIVIALLAVTAALYIWRISQTYSPQAMVVVYVISIILMFAGAYVILRRVVRRGYEQNRRLMPLPTFLQLLIWGLFFAFPCIYNPIDWAWSQSNISHAIPNLGFIGWTCVGGGLIIVIGAIAGLGLPRSFGQKGKKLELKGPYHVTRNPQLMGGVLLVVGYVILWPSWYALGWLALFIAMMHMMVLTEEEYLHSLHGEEYEQYSRRVPRYLGFRRKS